MSEQAVAGRASSGLQVEALVRRRGSAVLWLRLAAPPGVTVLLECDADLLTEALTDADSVYVQTNSRALHEADAVALVMRIKAAGEEAARRLGSPVRFVLRGDSTLRGHVFAESEAFLGPRGAKARAKLAS